VLEAEVGASSLLTAVFNDGHAAAWGTYLDLASATAADLLHAVIGTGIGGGIITGGQLLRGPGHFAGGIGHIKVSPNGMVRCSCGAYGCVETYASGPAIVRQARAAAAREPLLSDASSLPAVCLLARRGNAAAMQVIEEAGEWLGRAIGDAVNVVNPRIVTIGGGVVAACRQVEDDPSAGNPYVEAAATSVRLSAQDCVVRGLEIVEAPLLNDAALIGAAALATEHFRR
jgi:glucokinase